MSNYFHNTVTLFSVKFCNLNVAVSLLCWILLSLLLKNQSLIKNFQIKMFHRTVCKILLVFSLLILIICRPVNLCNSNNEKTDRNKQNKSLKPEETHKNMLTIWLHSKTQRGILV